MTALTLTEQPATQSVLLTITGAPAGPVTIIRTDPNGAAVVLLRAGQEPSGGTLIVTDYAVALAGLARYDVLDSAGIITTATITTTACGLAVLHAAVLPQYRATPELITTVDERRDTTTVIHEVIGRTDTLATLGKLRQRRGTLTCWVRTHATARALEGIANIGEVLLLRQAAHAGLDMHLIVDATSIRPATDGATSWLVDLSYIECPAPAGPLLGAAGWVCDTLAAFGTCAQAKARFATCADMLVGPQ